MNSHLKIHKNELKIASINIQCAQQNVTGKTFSDKEEELLNTILEEDFDIIGVSECDIEDFDPQKPYSIEGFNTYFPLNREGRLGFHGR